MTGTIVAVLTILLLVAAIIHFLINRGLKPVDDLAVGVAGASLNTRLPSDAVPRELKPIALEVNKLLARLQSVFERERRFTANAAHELTTPVAELRSITDVALRWGDDPKLAASAARSANEIAQQMERILRVLLALARSESARAQLHIEGVEVRSLLDEILHSLAARIADKKIELRANKGAAVIQSDHAMLRAILFNLLDNAVEYTPPGGKFHCDLNPTRLLIVNEQSDITPEDMPQLGEPFWRKDAAHSGGVHAGLGLTLVKSYAELLQMSFAIRLEEGTTFCVELKFAPSRTVSSA
jgi:signal transduction histidine kinase